MIRVLIVEDSALTAEMLASILQSDPDITVVGSARNGVEAVEMTPHLQPDLITMDVWMPRMDGFATVEQIMAYHPTPILVITASLGSGDVDISLRMLAAGALDVIEKPSRLDQDTWERSTRQLVRKVKLLSRVRVVTHLKGRRAGQPAAPLPVVPPTPPPASEPNAPVPPLRATIGQNGEMPAPRRPPFSGTPPPVTPLPPAAPPARTPPGEAEGSAPVRRRGQSSTLVARRGATGPLPSLPPHRPPRRGVNPYALLAIASSTGGPQALLTVLRNLPEGFPLPIVIVQHIAAGFTQGLADWLARECRRPVELATEGAKPIPGAALLAPDSKHLLIMPGGLVHLDAGPPEQIRPAADMLLRSVAAAYGERAIGVILTGMGRDGAEGLKALRLAGGYSIAQDEQTSLIFGMPRAAIALGVVDDVLPLEGIPARLEQLVTGRLP